jgi:hypothetical protein
MQRTRLLSAPKVLTTVDVESGESSSTKMISQSTPANAADTRSTTTGTLGDSLNVGMMTLRMGAGRAGKVAG